MLLHFVTLLPLLVLKESPGIVILLNHLEVGLLSPFQLFVDASLNFLAQGTHLVLLFLHQFGFTGQNLLLSVDHVLISFFRVKFVSSCLDLMGVLILFLLGKRLLDFPKVQQFC